MADGKVKISELSQALQLNDNAVFPYTQDNGGTDTTFKAPMTQIARKINEDMDYTNLETSSKKVVGAINQTVKNFAEVYDPTSTYNQNDPVLYGGTLYKCNANNVTGAWDSTKWDEAKAVEFGSGGGGASYATELPISSTDPTDTKSYIDTKTTLVKSASGSLIHITDGGDNIPLKSCEVTINPDLSGKTECNLVVCGANLFDKNQGNTTAGYINSAGAITLSADWRTSDYQYIKGGYYTFSGVDSALGGYYGVCWYDATQTLISGYQRFVITPIVVQIPDNAVYIRYSWHTASANTFIINVGQSAITPYAPYQATTYNIPFGQTVTTGGTLDVINGVLTVGGVETQLTPISPKTISGMNNIYNDCGSTAIEYFTSSADEESELFDVKTGGGYKIQPVIYSTDEREIGVWSDGKPLYEKTIDIAQYSVEAVDTEFRDVVAIADADFLVSAECSKQSPNTTQQLRFYISNGYLQVAAKTTITLTALVSYYVTIRYTKSTDTAGSGQWTPQGVPAHHYSTNEQIVGTWIDGKPLYEKTIDFGALPNTTTKSVNHNISNLDKVAFLNGVAYKSGDIIPIPFSHSGNVSNQTQLSIGNTTVNIRTANDQSDRTGYITVRYTKSS